MRTRNIYLTDEQYKKILLKIRRTVYQKQFKYSCFDSTLPGNKYTESNCGFCNDNFTDKETAMFPEEFPERKDMKYREANHKCPFDMRIKSKWGYADGCFYHCYLFQNKKYRGKNPDTKEIRELVDKTIHKVFFKENLWRRIIHLMKSLTGFKKKPLKS